MPIGTVPPPDQHPDDDPLICIPVNVEWIPILLGALQPLKYPEYWGGTLEENRRARKDFGLLLDQIMRAEDCMPSVCCEPQIYIYRVNPDSGRLERSADDGATWTPDPKDPMHSTVKLPPIPQGTLSDTKCNAATGFMEHFDDIITAQSENLGTAITIAELATAVAEVLLDIFVIIVTEGAGAPIIVGISTAIFAAAAAAFNEGKTAFDDYWTNDRKDTVLCDAFCTMGSNGQFTQAQWDNFRHKVRADLPAGAALDFTLTAVNAAGFVGASNLASYGNVASADCSECGCECSAEIWEIFSSSTERYGTIVEMGDDFIIFDLDNAPLTVGEYFLRVKSLTVDTCCRIDKYEVISGATPNISAYALCGAAQDGTCPHSLSGVDGSGVDEVNCFVIGAPAACRVKVTFVL